MADPIPPTLDAPQESDAPDGWELACIGIVRREFGRRPSRALDRALMQLSAEKAWIEERAGATKTGWWRRVQEAFVGLSGIQVGVAAALLLLLAGFSWVLMPSKPQPTQIEVTGPGCKISDAINARWTGSAKFKPGDYLPAGSFRLESGVIELSFSTGAKAAVEGPAEWKLTERNRIELQKGKLSTDVPHQAIGFTVRTPNATVVDLGTRFGIDARAKDSSEVDVFEGKVQVTQGSDAKAPDNEWNLTRNMAMILDSRGGVTTATAPETSFPQPSHVLLLHPVNCGFDHSDSTVIGGFPTAFGFWSGPSFALTGPIEGVRPAQGSGMMRFLPQRGASALDSVVWQLIDLHPAKDFVAMHGVVDLKAWVQFNRVAGDSHTASKFVLTIAAFRGQPAQAATLWAARNQTALAIGEKELVADNDPHTWEKVEAATTVTPDADFAVVEMRAVAPKGTPATVNPFPGHFADLIDAKVCLPLRASSVNLPDSK